MCTAGLQKQDWEFKKLNASEELKLDKPGCRSRMKPPLGFGNILKQYGCSDNVVKELWKWYNPPKEK